MTGATEVQDDPWLADQARDALSAIAALHEQAKAIFAEPAEPPAAR